MSVVGFILCPLRLIQPSNGGVEHFGHSSEDGISDRYGARAFGHMYGAWSFYVSTMELVEWRVKMSENGLIPVERYTCVLYA